MRKNPLQDCSTCPKYRKYHLNCDQDLSMKAFCTICVHREDREIEVYCRTNRFYQEGSGEDFECYRFHMARSAHTRA
ncbi:MAG TPA: hypothetical protein PK350_04235 [Deltaproteobacteria bacterium]|nr:hypothetical protein [Deltaproteobacteria bacterium]